MRLILYCKIISFFLYAPGIFAQNLEVRGQVVEKGTKKILKGVTIYILDAQTSAAKKVVTDAQGRYKVKNLVAGKKDFIVNIPDYKRVKQPITLKDKNLKIDFYLEKNSYLQYQTTVVGTREKENAAQETLKQSEFLQVPGSFGDPVKAVSNLPGIVQATGFSAEVAIQGSPAEDTRYFIEGHQIPFMFHFVGLNSIAVPETVGSIDFLSAGFGAEFGRASSGIINLNLSSPRTDRIHGMFFIDLLTSGGYLEGPIKKMKQTEFFIGGRYSYLGHVLKSASSLFEDDDGDAPSFNSAPTFFDFNFQFQQTLSERLSYKIVTLASRDQVDLIFESFDDPTFAGGMQARTDFLRIIPAITFKINEKLKLEASVGWGIDHLLFAPGVERIDYRRFQTSIKNSLTYTLNERLKFIWGSDTLGYRYDIENRISSSFFNSSDVEVPESASDLVLANSEGSEWNHGHYFKMATWLFNHKLQITPALRYDHFKLHGSSHFSPRGVIRYRIDETMNLYFQSGLYYQPADARQLEAGSGNPDLDPQRSVHYAFKVQKDFRKNSRYGFHLKSGFFYKSLKDIFTPSSEQVQRGENLVPEVLNNRQTGKIIGGEMLLTYRSKKWMMNLGYTYTRSRRTDADGHEHPSEQDQTHNINLTSKYSWKNWSIGGRFRYVTGSPYTPITGGIYYDNAGVFLPVQGERLSARLDNFWQVDFRLDRRWIMKKWVLTAYLDIQNITGRKNETAAEYNFDYTQEGRATGLPILPSFGIKGEF